MRRRCSFVYCLRKHGYTFVDIAKRINRTPETTRQMYYRHLRRMNRTLENSGLSLETVEIELRKRQCK